MIGSGECYPSSLLLMKTGGRYCRQKVSEIFTSYSSDTLEWCTDSCISSRGSGDESLTQAFPGNNNQLPPEKISSLLGWVAQLGRQYYFRHKHHSMRMSSLTTKNPLSALCQTQHYRCKYLTIEMGGIFHNYCREFLLAFALKVRESGGLNLIRAELDACRQLGSQFLL